MIGRLAGGVLAPRGDAAEAPAAVAPPLTTTMTAIMDNRRSPQLLLPLEPATALPPSTEDLLESRRRFDLPGLRRRRSCLPCPMAKPYPRCCPTWQVGFRVVFEGFDGPPYGRAPFFSACLDLVGGCALCHGLSAHTKATRLCCESRRTGTESFCVLLKEYRKYAVGDLNFGETGVSVVLSHLVP